MRSIFFLLIFTSATTLFAQEAVTTYYEDSDKVKEQYSILREDTLVILHGDYKMFSPTGKVIITGTYDQGKREGFFYNYYEDGTIQRETFYENNLKQGANQDLFT